MNISARDAHRPAGSRILARASLGVLVLAVGLPGLAAASAAPRVGADDATPAPQRALQSVVVSVAPDGSYTAVKGTTVTTSDGSEDAETKTATYSPQKVAADLPVRVLTSYRTEDGAGTDLADLDGYTGRVEIDLTVQNLTMRPTDLQYDVDGSSRSQAALVGAPLTVVASTALDGVQPSAVVTSGDGASEPASGAAGSAGTNGVLSQSKDGTPQVQWATILAPPQIGPSATLRLVVDAKDFKAPAFDLSVQPGLVTDPSVGALVDAAFRPGSSSELQLQARTIGLVGEVNTVLARAGATISRVRSTLDSSADTLGTKTVSDLQAGASGVASSMKGLDGSVKSLGKDLSTSLETTRSAAVEQLLQTVNVLDQMLGDTTIKPQPAAVKGTGCETEVVAPKDASSVYGNLLQVSGQLDGYAKATSACKTALQASILDSVGPAEPDAKTCAASKSVTCALFGAKDKFGKIATDLLTDGDKALAALDPMKIDDAVAAGDTLSTSVDSLVTVTGALGKAAPPAKLDLRDVRAALAQVGRRSQDLADAIDAVHSAAGTARAGTDPMVDRNTALAAELCQMVGDGTQPDTLSPAKVEELRSYLVGTGCDGTTPLTAPHGGLPMAAMIAAQQQQWDDVLAATNTGDGSQGTGQALAALGTSVDAVSTALDQLDTTVGDGNGNVRSQIGALTRAVGDLAGARDDVQKRLTTVKEQEANAVAGVQQALKDAAGRASDTAVGTVDPEIRQVTQSSADNSEALGKMFDKSASGLSSASGSIATHSAKTLNKQKAEFAKGQKAAGQQISEQVKQGLSSISQGVSSSTRDMEAASALLTQDLNRVLLDLGDRKVHGSGLLGAMTTSAATARSADYQLALATDKSTSYANVRSADIGGIMLRQAQSDAALKMLAELPAFGTDLPSGTEHRTVYTFHVGSGS